MKAARRAPRVWDRHEIMAEVRRRGSNLRQVSLAAGLSESTCRKALQEPQPAGEAAIAEFLDVTVQELWPDRYPTLSVSRSNDATNRQGESSLNAATDQTPDAAPISGVVVTLPTRASRPIP